MATGIIVFILCIAFLLGNLYLLKDLGAPRKPNDQKPGEKRGSNPRKIDVLDVSASSETNNKDE